MKSKLLLLLSSFVCLNLFSQNYIINDDFEADALGTLPNGWVIRYNGTGNANQKVVDNPVRNGTHAFQVSGSGWAANLSKSVAGITNDVSLECWMRADNVTTGGRTGIALGNPSYGTWGTFLARVEFYNGNIITYYHTGNSGGYGTQYVLQPADANIWYHIKIEANTADELYKVYINNAQASSNTTGSTVSEFPLLTTVPPTSIELYSNSMSYFDDVKMYETKKPVAFYPFNGNANDESGYDNHGTINGATLTTDRFGNADSAYYFDGDSNYISINDNPNINIQTNESFSVSFWFKHDAQNNATYMFSKYKGSFGEPSYGIGTGSDGDSYSWYEFSPSNGIENRGTIDLNDNNWHHLTSVFQSGASVSIYIDGVLDISHPITYAGSIINARNLTIGSGSNLAQFYKGAIDDLMIFKSALTETEVLSLFNNNSLDIKSSNPVVNDTFYYLDNTIYFNSDEKLVQIKELSIYNLMAQKVYISNNLTKELNLNFLNQGIYIINLEHKKGTFETRKVFVK